MLDTVGWIEHLADKTEKAIVTLRKSMDLEAIAANAYHLAAVHQARGTEEDVVQARQLARQAIQLDPEREKGEYGKLASALLAGDKNAGVVAFRYGCVVCIARAADASHALRWMLTPDLLP